MFRKWKGVSALCMAVLLGCLMPMGTMLAAEENAEKQRLFHAQTYVLSEGMEAPVIDIKWQGRNQARDLGGAVDYEYVNPYGQMIICSADQKGHKVLLSYYLDKVTDITAAAKGNEEMESLSWTSEPHSSQVQIPFLNDGNYVLYVKAEGEDGQISYARSGGIVIDTKAPEVTGVEEGKTYPAGTVFRVEDANLKSVTVNEKPVTPASDGSYQVAANGSSCVIKAEDKAGNNMSCSITISGKGSEEESSVISESGIYPLKAGVEYQLAKGRWSVNGDSTVYRGGSTFYVSTDGDYKFTRRWD